jgi:toxin YhaV
MGRTVTLVDDYKHWFRAKFFQQYRLFFRYHAATKLIVYALVNDEDTKRAYESGDDAYRIFRKLLEGGRPPDYWDGLLAEARAEADRLQELVAKTTAAQP